MKNYIDIAIEAAKIGALHAQTFFHTDVTIERKNDMSPVTQADRETEQKIRSYILTLDPHAQFVGEELGSTSDSDNYWLIDPIDGTGYFVRGIPLWSTLITYIHKGEPVVGVSYMPVWDDLLYAEKGSGAYKNNVRVSVSKRQDLSDAFIAYSSFFKITDKLPGFSYLCSQAFKAKTLGDSYAYHLLASGSIEAKFDGSVYPYDVAGMSLIVKEAGGKVTNFSNQEWTLEDKTIVASNGFIHDLLLSRACLYTS